MKGVIRSILPNPNQFSFANSSENKKVKVMGRFIQHFQQITLFNNIFNRFKYDLDLNRVNHVYYSGFTLLL